MLVNNHHNKSRWPRSRRLGPLLSSNPSIQSHLCAPRMQQGRSIITKWLKLLRNSWPKKFPHSNCLSPRVRATFYPRLRKICKSRGSRFRTWASCLMRSRGKNSTPRTTRLHKGFLTKSVSNSLPTTKASSRESCTHSPLSAQLMPLRQPAIQQLTIIIKIPLLPPTTSRIIRSQTQLSV